MTASLIQEMFAGLVEELGIVVGATIDSTAAVSAGVPATGRQWVAQVSATGDFNGSITVVLDHAGAAAITQVMTGIEGDIPDEAVLDTIREVLAQAVSALALKPVARGAKLAVVDVTAGEGHVPEGRLGEDGDSVVSTFATGDRRSEGDTDDDATHGYP